MVEFNPAKNYNDSSSYDFKPHKRSIKLNDLRKELFKANVEEKAEPKKSPEFVKKTSTSVGQFVALENSKNEKNAIGNIPLVPKKSNESFKLVDLSSQASNTLETMMNDKIELPEIDDSDAPKVSRRTIRKAKRMARKQQVDLEALAKVEIDKKNAPEFGKVDLGEFKAELLAQEKVLEREPFEVKTHKKGSLGGGTKTISFEEHKKIEEIAEKFGCKYDDLIAVMNFESGINPQSGAEKLKRKPVGLIQFTKPSINMLNERYGLNLTKAKIVKMSTLEQLDLVEKYFEVTKSSTSRLRNKKNIDAADLYSMVILPGRAGKDILCQAGEVGKDGRRLNYYEHNKGIDVGNDGYITRADVIAKLDQFRVDIKVV